MTKWRYDMSNIWEFLYQTVTVSLVAVLILVLRKIFDGKLSPRFMYFVWGVLALRVLVPASLTRNTGISLGLTAEYVKSVCERSLSSAYASEFTPITMKAPFPYITQAPKSVTDVIFIVYIAGIFVFLFVHTLSYIRLRLALKYAPEAAAENTAKVRAVCEKYGLKPCRVKEAAVPTAFVCGVFRPVLVLPADAETDEKIILHEMLHLKYKDIAVGIFICILRALHWCNPLLFYVFSRIENDIEKLCDHRVLELLSGEERREYGKLLLLCANEKYARAVGTSSVSNGGKNIAARIENIVRFKKYPRGMAIVSVCIVIVMCAFCVIGVKAEYNEGLYNPTYGEYEEAFAMSRINRCTTPAGALDAFAKVKIYKNSVYLAMCSPMDMQAEFLANAGTDASYDMGLFYAVENFSVVNMREDGDGSYTAYVAINVGAYYKNSELVPEEGCVFIPVRVYKENGWVVEEIGERIVFEDNFYNYNIRFPAFYNGSYEAQSGTLTCKVFVQSLIESNFPSFAHFIENKHPDTDAQFTTNWIHSEGNFAFNKEIMEGKKWIGFVATALNDVNEEAKFPSNFDIFPESDDYSSKSGGANDGTFWEFRRLSSGFAGNLVFGSGTAYSDDYGNKIVPKAYKYWIVADGEIIEEFTVEVTG